MLRSDHRHMGDDEEIISKGYRNGYVAVLVYGLLPAGAFYFGDEKAAFYLGYIGIVYLLNDMINRLYNLCIRLSRTNELLVDGHEERRWRKKAG